MFENILSWIRKAWSRMNEFTTTIKKSLNIDVEMSDPMAKAIDLWAKLYVNNADWLLEENVYSLNLPAAISAEIARVSTIEMDIRVEGENERAIFITSQIKRMIDKMRESVEYGAAKGNLIFKPFVDGDKVSVEIVQGDMFYPVTFDSDGKIISVIFIDRLFIKDRYYTKLEYHSLTPIIEEDGQQSSGYEIINKAFRSDTKNMLGVEVLLTEVDDWADLEPIGILKNVDRPLFGFFRYPLANQIDPGSPLGVSCFSRAIDLIEQADRLWSDLLWEFKSGKRKVFVDALAFTKDSQGRVVLPDKNLYQTLNTGGSNIGEDTLFKEWSPTFREMNILNGLEAILRKIEYNCGMDYGRLSNPETVDKTATEISASQQRFYSTIRDVQKALEDAVNDLLYGIDTWATVEKLVPTGAYTTTFEFDDSIVTNKAEQFLQDSQAVNLQVMSKVEFRMRNYNEDETTAKKMLAMVETTPSLFDEGA